MFAKVSTWPISKGNHCWLTAKKAGNLLLSISFLFLPVVSNVEIYVTRRDALIRLKAPELFHVHVLPAVTTAVRRGTWL